MNEESRALRIKELDDLVSAHDEKWGPYVPFIFVNADKTQSRMVTFLHTVEGKTFLLVTKLFTDRPVDDRTSVKLFRESQLVLGVMSYWRTNEYVPLRVKEADSFGSYMNAEYYQLFEAHVEIIFRYRKMFNLEMLKENMERITGDVQVSIAQPVYKYLSSLKLEIDIGQDYRLAAKEWYKSQGYD
uniref:Uncharacterized protein n=1 Tax=viral metagenome TaxID=1070528 RepID=A0A2V0RLG5_9ZZZZ